MSDNYATGGHLPPRLPGSVPGLIGGQNPMLIDPLRGSNVVQPIQGFTAAYPQRDQEDFRYYYCEMKNHHMHRPDGKRLAFHTKVLKTGDVILQMLATKDIYDIAYLDQEISAGNPYIRPATEQEIELYNMRIDPRTTMKRALGPEMEAEITRKLMTRLSNMGVQLSDAQLAELSGSTLAPVPGPDPLEGNQDAGKISGTDARLQALKAGIKTGSGTMLLQPDPAAVAETAAVNQANQTTTFQSGVVGTDKLPNAVDSNSTAGTQKS